MKKGKKWHFHVKVTPGTRPIPRSTCSILGCQDSVCQRGWGLNECVTGQDERFLVLSTARWDLLRRRGHHVERRRAAPGPRGTARSGATASKSTARPVTTATSSPAMAATRSAGKNSRRDPPTRSSPTTSRPPTRTCSCSIEGALRVTGQVGSKCDFDSYAVEVAEGGSVRALLESTGSDTCDVDLKLQLVDTDGLAPIKTVRTSAGTCPVIEGTESWASNSRRRHLFRARDHRARGRALSGARLRARNRSTRSANGERSPPKAGEFFRKFAGLRAPRDET